MTRSSSPNGLVEFSYDFPVASTSALSAQATTRPHRASPPRLPPSPLRPRWEGASALDDEDDDEEIDYDAFGYPAPARRQTHPTALPATRNQWRAPSPTTTNSLYPYPYAPSAYSAPAYTSPTYSAPAGRKEEKCATTSLALRRQWAALSLRVRFGVFRAKRRMRARVMSL
ncbi:hypothetical protein C8R44DRAFT_766828 [Mycena epipterygia]|nr:hypothetical protein C8R44DRAFT_766828 [Mycena epipterygia]